MLNVLAAVFPLSRGTGRCGFEMILFTFYFGTIHKIFYQHPIFVRTLISNWRKLFRN
jgi:hypothetical protein